MNEQHNQKQTNGDKNDTRPRVQSDRAKSSEQNQYALSRRSLDEIVGCTGHVGGLWRNHIELMV